MSAENTKRTKVIERVKALLAKTTENGCTEAEAIEAAKKVGQIMSEYNLAMSDIDMREEAKDCDTEYFDTGSSRNGPGVYICQGIDRFFGVKSWIQRTRIRGHARVKYAYFGLPADVSGARHLTQVLFSAMEREAVAYLKKHGGSRAAGASFRQAFAQRVSVRLIRLAIEREAATRKSTTGTALVELKDQLVEQKYHDLSLRFTRRPYQPSGGGDVYAAAAGYAAGERASLSAGIDDSGSRTRSLPAA